MSFSKILEAYQRFDTGLWLSILFCSFFAVGDDLGCEPLLTDLPFFINQSARVSYHSPKYLLFNTNNALN
jgi:hypothetical protein